MKSVIFSILLVIQVSAFAEDAVIVALKNKYTLGHTPQASELRAGETWMCRSFDVWFRYKKAENSNRRFSVKFSTFDGLIAVQPQFMPEYIAGIAQTPTSDNALYSAIEQNNIISRAAIRISQSGDIIIEESHGATSIYNRSVDEMLKTQEYPAVEFPSAKVMAYVICPKDKVVTN